MVDDIYTSPNDWNNYLEHRSHKYIRRERGKNGKYRYWYYNVKNKGVTSTSAWKAEHDRLQQKSDRIKQEKTLENEPWYSYKRYYGYRAENVKAAKDKEKQLSTAAYKAKKAEQKDMSKLSNKVSYAKWSISEGVKSTISNGKAAISKVLSKLKKN